MRKHYVATNSKKLMYVMHFRHLRTINAHLICYSLNWKEYCQGVHAKYEQNVCNVDYVYNKENMCYIK